MANEVKVTRRRIDDYRPQVRNVNKGSERGLQVIEDSLNYNGAGRSLVADKDGEIIAGSQTIQAAENAGIRDVIEVETNGDALVIVKRVDLDVDGDGEAAARAKALSIADNRAHELSYTQDDVMLAELLEEIRNEDEALLKGALVTDAELDALLEDLGGDVTQEDTGAQIERASELQKKWQTERGQLWVIPSEHGGEHRLLCGDSTNADDVHKLLLPDKYLFFCDPFFQDDLIAKMRATFDARAAVYITGGHQIKDVVCGLSSFHEGVLLGLSSIPQMGNTHKLFYEHKAVFWVADYPLDFGVGFSSVIHNDDGATRKYGDVYHHTSKPVDMIEKLIKPFRETSVVDPFSGSGTTFVACERLRRHCYGIEIEPGYVAAILQRLSLMGLSPRLA